MSHPDSEVTPPPLLADRSFESLREGADADRENDRAQVLEVLLLKFVGGVQSIRDAQPTASTSNR
jgi:hypothetical protein